MLCLSREKPRDCGLCTLITILYCIIWDNGNIYVTGGSFGSNTMSDYVTIRLDASNGNQIWLERYDYIQLNDAAANIKLSGTTVVVSGGSQISVSPDRWELATLKYDVSNGSLLNTRRSSGNATQGVDEVYDLP